jgi:hypothetical protein
MYIAFSCPSLLSSGSFDINSIYIHWPRGCWRTRQLLLAVIHRLPFWHSHISCDYVHSSICEQVVNYGIVTLGWFYNIMFCLSVFELSGVWVC